VSYGIRRSGWRDLHFFRASVGALHVARYSLSQKQHRIHVAGFYVAQQMCGVLQGASLVAGMLAGVEEAELEVVLGFEGCCIEREGSKRRAASDKGSEFWVVRPSPRPQVT